MNKLTSEEKQRVFEIYMEVSGLMNSLKPVPRTLIDEYENLIKKENEIFN